MCRKFRDHSVLRFFGFPTNCWAIARTQITNIWYDKLCTTIVKRKFVVHKLCVHGHMGRKFAMANLQQICTQICRKFVIANLRHNFPCAHNLRTTNLRLKCVVHNLSLKTFFHCVRAATHKFIVLFLKCVANPMISAYCIYWRFVLFQKGVAFFNIAAFCNLSGYQQIVEKTTNFKTPITR